MRGFGDIARQEYRAVGIHVALHPMADVATEPRWARIGGTFGEDIELVGRLTAAYIRGFQGDELGPTSVACMTKHFPGGGPQADGEDPHFPYGKDQVYPGGRFDDHLRPFEAAFAAGTAQVMPYYGRPVGTELEPVGFGFNREVITGLLRGRYGFDGVVCTDWALVSDLPMPDGSVWEAKAWGVEELDAADRLFRIIDAGCDQLGGETPAGAARRSSSRTGRVSEARIDESARRILRDKFRLGLFDDPYVDPEAAATICGRDGLPGGRRRGAAPVDGADRERRSAAARARARGSTSTASPRKRPRPYGEVVEQPGATPTPRSCSGTRRTSLATATFIESLFHAGSLEFPPGERDRVLEIAARGSDDPRRASRPPGDPDRARRRVRRRRRDVRREPGGDPRSRVRPLRADRQAPLRAPLVDGRGRAGSSRTCPATPRQPLYPARARAHVRRCLTDEFRTAGASTWKRRGADRPAATGEDET